VSPGGSFDLKKRIERRMRRFCGEVNRFMHNRYGPIFALRARGNRRSLTTVVRCRYLTNRICFAKLLIGAVETVENSRGREFDLLKGALVVKISDKLSGDVELDLLRLFVSDGVSDEIFQFDLIWVVHFPVPFKRPLRSGISVNNILHTVSIVVMMSRIVSVSISRDRCPRVEVDRVIEPPAPSATPRLPNEP